MKKAVTTVAILGTLFLTSACTHQRQITNAQENQQETVKEMSATYLGKVDNIHVKLEMDGTKKLVEIAPTLGTMFEGIQLNDYITFQYKTDRSNAMTITALKEWRKSIGAEENDETEEDTKSIDNQKENENTYTIQTMSGYTFESKENDTSRVYNNDTPSFYADIERIDAGSNIQKQRWQAASDLKPVGPLKEIKETNLVGGNQQVKFIFEAKNSDTKERIAVIETDGALFKYTVTIPNEDGNDEIEQDLWKMLARISVNE